MTAPDADREVPLADADELDVLPDQTSDERSEGWGDRRDEELANEQRLLEDRPPHW